MDNIGLNADPRLWNVTRQSVDVVDTTWIRGCYSGAKCLDLDGTTRLGGRVQSQEFTFTAGATYTLTFYLSENQRGFSFAGSTDQVTVSLGNLTSQTFALASTVSYTWKKYTMQVTGDGSRGTITFDHAGGDNVGILLDDVDLDKIEAPLADTELPEPATMGLIGAGLVAAGLRRKMAA